MLLHGKVSRKVLFFYVFPLKTLRFYCLSSYFHIQKPQNTPSISPEWTFSLHSLVQYLHGVWRRVPKFFLRNFQSAEVSSHRTHRTHSNDRFRTNIRRGRVKTPNINKKTRCTFLCGCTTSFCFSTKKSLINNLYGVIWVK